MKNKITIIGNIAGGKSILARKLSMQLGIPVTHIDSLQFLPGMKIRPLIETRKNLADIESQNAWIIDGFGPLDGLEPRLKKADVIVFVDLPFYRHFYWLLLRQVKSVWSPRSELPKDCNELTWSHTFKLFRTLINNHRKMRPELVRILQRSHYKEKLYWVRSCKQLRNTCFKI